MNPNTLRKEFEERFLRLYVSSSDNSFDATRCEQAVLSFLEQKVEEAYARGRSDAVEYVNTNLMWGRSERKELVIDSRHMAEVLEAARKSEKV
jgi:hypothetical protein